MKNDESTPLQPIENGTETAEERLAWQVPWDDAFDLVEALDPSQRLAAVCGAISAVELDDGERFHTGGMETMFRAIGVTLIGFPSDHLPPGEGGTVAETDEELHECFTRSMHAAALDWMVAHGMIAPDRPSLVPHEKGN